MEIKVENRSISNCRGLISSLLIPTNFVLSQKYIFTCLMTKHWFGWIGNWIYWALINRNYQELWHYC
jgi:hypothetical protein